jgi:uncharacterized protein YjbI with pentapeptide repeats
LHFSNVGGYPSSILALVLLALLICTTAEGYSAYTPPPMKVIQASEILNKIETGLPVEYDHTLIKGNLILSKLNLPVSYFRLKNTLMYYDYIVSNYVSENLSIVSSQIRLNECQIEGSVDFGNTIFMKSINFENTYFNGTTSLTSSLFIGNAYFKSCNFNGPFEARYAIFGNECDFSGSFFKFYSDFRYAKFMQNADFNKIHFEVADFTRSHFYARANFLNVNFIGDALFSESQFSKDANFNSGNYTPTAVWDKYESIYGTGNTNFEESADFSSSQFNGKANFHWLIFRKNADFSLSNFTDEADFAASEFKQYANFRNAQFLNGADFSMSQIREESDFIGAMFFTFLDLTKAEFNHINIYLPEGTRLVCDDGPTYLNLIKNFRDLEKYEVADNIYFQYRDWRQNQRSWSDSNKYTDILSWLSCGYGVHWEYTIFIGIVTNIIFGIFFFVKKRILSLNMSEKIIRLKESILFSLVILLSAPTDWYVILFGIDTYQAFVRENKYSIFLERIIGWSLVVLLINTLSRVMIRY